MGSFYQNIEALQNDSSLSQAEVQNQRALSTSNFNDDDHLISHQEYSLRPAIDEEMRIDEEAYKKRESKKARKAQSRIQESRKGLLKKLVPNGVRDESSRSGKIHHK